MKKWTLNSWRNYPVKHIPKYEDEKELAMVLKKVGSFPPLVFAGITRALKKSLAQVSEGKALLLPFEQSMTRIDSTSGKHHDTSAHFVWIGDRTRQIDGGHVEFCKGIENPIGIKCGPTSKPDEIVKICNVINSKNEKGKITLISRFG